MHLLKYIWVFLNPSQTISPDLLAPKQPLTSFGLFTSIASTQKATKILFKVEVSLFHKFYVENANGFDPLIMWWVANESKFPNVGFLVGIFLASQVHKLRLSGYF
jgi:hypothetical protein